MSFLKKVKSAFGYTATNRLVNKEAEYRLYEKVSQELANGEKDAGVWTAAFSKAEGDEKKAEAKYIELMVQLYKDSIEAGLELEEILESNFEENLRRKERESQNRRNRYLYKGFLFNSFVACRSYNGSNCLVYAIIF